MIENNSTVEGCVFHSFYLNMRTQVVLILYPIVCFVGIPANIIGAVVLLREKKKSTTTIILLSITVSDLIHIVNDFLYFVCIVLETIVDVKTSHQALDVIHPYTIYMYYTTITCTAWMTVTVAVERYINVCHASKAKQICTVTRAIYTSIGIMIVAMAISIPYGFDMCPKYDNSMNKSENTNMSVCAMKTIYHLSYYLIRTVLPIVLVVVLSCFIIRRLKGSRLIQARNKMTITLIIVLTTFVVCVLPDMVVSTIAMAMCYNDNCLIIQGALQITDFLLLVNSVLNIIIYSASNTIFKNAFKRMLNCRKTSNDLLM
jgi:nociceptin receptor